MVPPLVERNATNARALVLYCSPPFPCSLSKDDNDSDVDGVLCVGGILLLWNLCAFYNSVALAGS